MHQIAKFIPAVAVSCSLAACGSSSSSTSSPSASASQASGGGATAVVRTASVASVGGSVLVNSHGLTLYRLSGEQSGKWICTTTACVKAWHPLTASTSGTPNASVGSLGTIKRPDGTVQVTYKGMPLYTFAGDGKSGEANGQGLKDVGVWTAVTANGATTPKPAAPTPAASSSSSSSSGGGGYGY